METERGPLSSPSWFITFPPTILSLRLQTLTLPRRYSREAGLCSACNFKAHAPLLFFLSTYSLPLLLYLYSLSPLHCSINIFPLYSLFVISSLSCSFPPFSHPLSPSESHQPKDIKDTSPPLVAVICPVAAFHAKARYPQGRIQSGVETHCFLSGEESVEKVTAHIRNCVILGGMYGQMAVKCIRGIVTVGCGRMN